MKSNIYVYWNCFSLKDCTKTMAYVVNGLAASVGGVCLTVPYYNPSETLMNTIGIIIQLIIAINSHYN